MKRVLAVLGREEGASLLQSTRSSAPYGSAAITEDNEEGALGSMRLLMSFASQREPSLPETSNKPLFLSRPLPARAVDRILAFLDARSRAVATRLVSKSCCSSSGSPSGDGAGLLQAMRTLSRKLRPAVFVKPVSGTPTLAVGGAVSSPSADVEAAAASSSSSSNNFYSSSSNTSCNSNWGDSSYQTVAAEMPMAVAVPVSVGVGVGAERGSTVDANADAATQLAAAPLAGQRHRRLPAVVLLVACGLAALCGVLRLAWTHPLAGTDPLPPPATVP